MKRYIAHIELNHPNYEKFCELSAQELQTHNQKQQKQLKNTRLLPTNQIVLTAHYSMFFE